MNWIEFVQSMQIRILTLHLLFKINYEPEWRMNFVKLWIRITWNYIYQGIRNKHLCIWQMKSDWCCIQEMRLTGSYAFPYKVSIPYMYADWPNWKFVATVAMPSICFQFPGNAITDVWVYVHYNVRCFRQLKYNSDCNQPFLLQCYLEHRNQ